MVRNCTMFICYFSSAYFRQHCRDSKKTATGLAEQSIIF